MERRDDLQGRGALGADVLVGRHGRSFRTAIGNILALYRLGVLIRGRRRRPAVDNRLAAHRPGAYVTPVRRGEPMAQHRRTITRFLARHRRSDRGAVRRAGHAQPGSGTASARAGARWPSWSRSGRCPPAIGWIQADLRGGRRWPLPSHQSSGTAASADELTGQVLAAPVTGGEPIVSARLLAPRWSVWVGPRARRRCRSGSLTPERSSCVDAGQRLDVLAASGAELGEGAAPGAARGRRRPGPRRGPVCGIVRRLALWATAVIRGQ